MLVLLGVSGTPDTTSGPASARDTREARGKPTEEARPMTTLFDSTRPVKSTRPVATGLSAERRKPYTARIWNGPLAS